tara:strand:- start:158 stop:292 length:135 start_codon:yes stop_codon:yes gene_type:complete
MIVDTIKTDKIENGIKKLKKNLFEIFELVKDIINGIAEPNIKIF